MVLVQSNAIARYLGRTYLGLNGEVLYPEMDQPEQMHAIDEILELNSELLMKQGFTFNTDNYDDKVNKFL